MHGQVRRLCERCPAQCAEKRPLPSVQSPVYCQRARLRESLPAVAAAELLLPRVHDLVALVGVGSGELVVADVTLEGLGISVVPLVDGEGG